MGQSWVVGVDLVHIKAEATLVNENRLLQRQIRRSSDMAVNQKAFGKEIITAQKELQDGLRPWLIGVGNGTVWEYEEQLFNGCFFRQQIKRMYL